MEIEQTQTNHENLLAAIKAENLESVKSILQTGFQIETPDSQNWTPLMHACDTNKTPAIAAHLIKNGANINAKGLNGYSPLLIVCQYNLNEELLSLLLENKVDITTTDNYGWNALIHASQFNNKKVIQLLLAENIDIEKKNNNGWTAMMFAEENGRESEIVKLLKVFKIEDLRERVEFVVKEKFFDLFERVSSDYRKVRKEGEEDGFFNLYVLYGGEDLEMLRRLGWNVEDRDSFGWGVEGYGEWRKRQGNINYLKIMGQ